MKKIKATIYYTVDKKHPDYKYIKNPDRVQEFSDTYTFDTDNYRSICYGATVDQMENYIKNDLKLIAGGGYDSKHIHNIKFEFEKVG